MIWREAAFSWSPRLASGANAVNVEPCAEPAFDRQPAAMAGEDVLDDGEAEAGAALGAALAGVDAVEAFGQARQMFGRDAAAVVAHDESAVLAAVVVTVISTRTAPAPSAGAPYLIAFSIRFSATRTNSSRSPSTMTGRLGVELQLDAHFARQRRQRVGDMARRSAPDRPRRLGRTCCFCSMRDSDSRSSISRAMRRPCSRMMARNLSRALASSPAPSPAGSRRSRAARPAACAIRGWRWR